MPLIHVCLVSEETIRNLLPVLTEEPDHLLLVVRPRMQGKGLVRRYRRFLQDRAVEVEVFEGTHGTTMDKLQENALALCELLEDRFAGWEVVLNLSEGTKLMTLAYLEALRHLLQPRLKAIYCDLLEHEIDVIVPPQTRSQPLPHLFDVRQYLAAQGVTLRRADSDEAAWCERANERKALTKRLAQRIERIESLVGTLNWHALRALSRDRKRLETPLQEMSRTPRGEWAEFLGMARDQGLVEWWGKRKFSFESVDAARYLGGGWLEELAWHVVIDQSPDEVRAGVEVTWDGAGRSAPRNEFDLLVVHHNRLLVVECKTARMDGVGGPEGSLYKLDSLASGIGGLYSTTLLLSARDLGEDQRKRAEHQGIHALCQRQINDLRGFVLDWMSGRDDDLD